MMLFGYLEVEEKKIVPLMNNMVLLGKVNMELFDSNILT
jgi:hypothetical protein